MSKVHSVRNGLVGDSLILASSCSKSNVQIGFYLTEMNLCFTRTPTWYLPAHFSFSTVKIKYRYLWHSIKFATRSNNHILISLAEEDSPTSLFITGVSSISSNLALFDEMKIVESHLFDCSVLLILLTLWKYYTKNLSSLFCRRVAKVGNNEKMNEGINERVV